MGDPVVPIPNINTAVLALSATERTPQGQIPFSVARGLVDVDDIHVINAALPIAGSTLIDAQLFGESLWGKTARVIARLPNGTIHSYFIKVLSQSGDVGKQMCHGEFESLKAIHQVSPGFVPQPYAWGEISEENESYFLLVEFREIAQQPAEPATLGARLADMHGLPTCTSDPSHRPPSLALTSPRATEGLSRQ
ncbi:hypothetical protein QBC43DRAFT_284026 [Cladorrhinum sp. PSN259]|nr:hypothetical protein QBC43DRAFT_284026 [Cladorrhinum sp. PSN259]